MTIFRPSVLGVTFVRPFKHLPTILVSSLLLASCGGDDFSTSFSTISGVAAVGAPISGATVSIKCQSGSATASTNATGNYSATVAGAVFPCALRSTGGLANGTPAPTLHSFVTAPGRANITPLTDLALALQVNNSAGQAIAIWFNTPSNWDNIGTGLAGAIDILRDAMVTAGYSVPASWAAGSTAPFTGTFVANPASDPFDQLLDALAEAIDNSATYADYDALLAAFASTPGGAALPDAPEEDEPSNPGTCTGDTKTLFATVAGTHSLNANLYLGTADTRYVAGQPYNVTIDSDNCTISIATEQGTEVYGGGITPAITTPVPANPASEIFFINLTHGSAYDQSLNKAYLMYYGSFNPVEIVLENTYYNSSALVSWRLILPIQ